MQESIKITFYEPWMDRQVIELFCKEYGNSFEKFSNFFSFFYNHEYQIKAIRVVAVSGNVVAGFASFCKWPYIIDGKIVNSFQCGNVIINKDYRGKGLYNKMLSFLDEQHDVLNIDLVVGFPIKEILKLYLKGGWKNPFNLSWYIKIINIFSFFLPYNEKRLLKAFKSKPCHFPILSKGHIELVKDNSFTDWHESFSNDNKYYYYNYEESNSFIEFTLKINIRKKIIKELIIGDINTNCFDFKFLLSGLEKLSKLALKTNTVSILSFALNDSDLNSNLYLALKKAKFKKIDKEIKFIYKNYKTDESIISEPKNWILYRRDLDTW